MEVVLCTHKRRGCNNIVYVKMRHESAAVKNARHGKCDKRRICEAESIETQRRHTVWRVTC